MADKKWANQILCKASKEVKKMLSREEQLNWHNVRSGAMMVASLGSLILNRTVSQDGKALILSRSRASHLANKLNNSEAV